MGNILGPTDTKIPILVGMEESRALLTLLREQEKRRNENKLADYWPYAKQIEFHKAGATYRERLFQAANQSGKTVSAGHELAMHLTGLYPTWWKGHRFNRVNNWLAGSETGDLTKKGIQRILLGRDIKTAIGTGAIPKSKLDRVTLSRHVADFADTIYVKHISGGVSSVGLKSYDQGRERWQADTVDGIWFDEEPPMDIYTEGITRTNVSLGPIMVTFTPLKGMTPLVQRFTDGNSPSTIVIDMTIFDAEHYSDHQRTQIIASYPEHEREARAYGKPMLGSGLVYPVARSVLECEPFSIPKHWARIVGLDFGHDHPTAAVWLAWDRDADIIYVTDVYSQRGAFVPVHAQAIKARGDWIPVSWPHDGLNETAAGPALASQYVQNGVNMLPSRAEFERTGVEGETENSLISVEAGVSQMLERMQTGRWKVFKHLEDYFREHAFYHRDNGKIVKVMDDVLCAARYGFVMRRFASTPPVSENNMRPPSDWRT